MQQSNGSKDDNLVEINDLKTYFQVGRKGIGLGLFSDRKTVHAVDGVSLTIRRGETLGLVGESGCGKSTLGYTILRLERAQAGEVYFEGWDVFGMSRRELRQVRRRMQIIFQDPASVLDPRMTVGQAIAEPLRVHGIASKDEIDDKVVELLETVGLNPYFKNRYPHEFSSASSSPGPCLWTLSSSCATSRSPHSTSPSRRRSSTCWRSFRNGWG